MLDYARANGSARLGGRHAVAGRVGGGVGGARRDWAPLDALRSVSRVLY